MSALAKQSHTAFIRPDHDTIRFDTGEEESIAFVRQCVGRGSMKNQKQRVSREINDYFYWSPPWLLQRQRIADAESASPSTGIGVCTIVPDPIRINTPSQQCLIASAVRCVPSACWTCWTCFKKVKSCVEFLHIPRNLTKAFRLFISTAHGHLL